MRKADVRGLLEAFDMEGVLVLARRQRRVLSLLLGLTYDPDEVIAWRAVEGLGLAAVVVAEGETEFVRGILRRLLWSLNDESGGIGWKSPQGLGAIVAGRLDLFSEFVPIIISLFEMEEELFRPGTLWAVGCIGAQVPNLVAQAVPWIVQLLADPDPQTRAHACRCAGQVGVQDALPILRDLADDKGKAIFYQQGGLHRVSVGDAARETIGRLASQR